MKLLKTVVLTLVILLIFSNFSINQANAEEVSQDENQNVVEDTSQASLDEEQSITENTNELSEDEKQNIVEEANSVAEEYGLTPVSEKQLENIPDDQMLNFDSVNQFEEFLQEDQTTQTTQTNSLNGSTNNALSTISNLSLFPTTAYKYLSGSIKTYYSCERNATGSIWSYARVNRNTKGIVQDVKVWSEQTGLIFGVTWTERATWYNLNSSKKNGTAYVRGTKLYGANVLGQAVGYSKSVTYDVGF